MRLWKILGLAGLLGVGVAAGAQAVQRHRREYREADSDELRASLHARLRDADGRTSDG